MKTNEIKIEQNELTTADYVITYACNDAVTITCAYTHKIIATHPSGNTAKSLRFIREFIGDETGEIVHRFGRSLYDWCMWN